MPSCRASVSARGAYLFLLLVLSAGCAREAPRAVSDVESLPEGAPAERTVRIVPRTPALATYPCGEQCHDARAPDPTPRELSTFHAGRRVAHGPALTWCGDCHAIAEPDHLVALDGTTPISFDASDALCAQCHGERHRDWAEGIHGLSTGGWRGTVERRLCTACHDPHAPDRIALEALPPPALDPRARAPREAPGDGVPDDAGVAP